MPERRRFLLCCLTATVAVTGCAAVMARDYPAKPVTFFVPFAAGSATDTLARSLGQGITGETRQNVVIDNRPGANGFIAAQAVVRAAPDGYASSCDQHHARCKQHLFKEIPYDRSDFAPSTALARGGRSCRESARDGENVKEFIALAKRQPASHLRQRSSSSRVASERSADGALQLSMCPTRATRWP